MKILALIRKLFSTVPDTDDVSTPDAVPLSDDMPPNAIRISTPHQLPNGRRVLSAMPTHLTPREQREAGYLPLSSGLRRVAVLLEVDNSRLALVVALGHVQAMLEVKQLVDERLPHRQLTLYMAPADYIPALYDQSLRTALFDNQHSLEVLDDFDTLVRNALKAGASDILIQGNSRLTTLQFLIDGFVCHHADLSANQGAELLRAIYRAAPVDAQHGNVMLEVPQETSLDRLIDGKALRLRYQHCPVNEGTDAVLRILRLNSRVEPSLNGLGYMPDQGAVLTSMATDPSSMVLMTGPTGSGKSMSLATLVTVHQAFHEGRRHIRELSNPVEYVIDGARQTTVVIDPNASPAQQRQEWLKYLRAFLRMVPQTILLGEIRDPDTALAVLECGATGHKIFSTVHGNTVDDVYLRLDRFSESDPALYSDGFVGAIVAQKLIPVLCTGCARTLTQSTLPAHRELLARISGSDVEQIMVRGGGCEACANNLPGIHGRTVAAEIFVPNRVVNAALKRQNYGEARDIWSQSDVPLAGRTIADHVHWHVLNGRIDPLIADRFCKNYTAHLVQNCRTLRSVS